MKKILALCLASMMMMGTLAGCGAKEETTETTAPATTETTTPATTETTEPEATAWAPSEDIEWIVTSGAGGGSDIFTRLITDIVRAEGLTDQTFLVNNQTDGGGEIGRNTVATAKDGDHMLLTFNSGDLTPMVTNTANRVENFKVICTLAIDRQLLLAGQKTPYADFAEAVEAAKAGTTVAITGSKGGDDVAVYEQMLASLGLTEAQMPYLVQDSTADAITMLLGGHAQYCISKPAASAQYLESGDAIASVALAKGHFAGDLADLPLLSEAVAGATDVESALWRGIVAPASMSDEAVAYWSDVMEAVSETDTWNNDYIEANMITPMFMAHDEATEYMITYQNEYLAG